MTLKVKSFNQSPLILIRAAFPYPFPDKLSRCLDFINHPRTYLGISYLGFNVGSPSFKSILHSGRVIDFAFERRRNYCILSISKASHHPGNVAHFLLQRLNVIVGLIGHLRYHLI